MGTDAHSKKKRKRKLRKEKSRYGIPALAATVHPPPIQHLNSMLFKRDTSKKGTVHKHHRRPIKDFRFLP
jgi:hypothetical protein